MLLLFIISIYFYYYYAEGIPSTGRGFFYKLSFFLFQNNLLFFLTSFLGMFMSLLILKKEIKFLYIIIFLNLMSSNFIVSQKYFEPLFIVLTFILFKNFFSENIINFKKNTLIFIFVVLAYFVIANINVVFNISKNLTTAF